jgi:hypothetical protein
MKKGTQNPVLLGAFSIVTLTIPITATITLHIDINTALTAGLNTI